MKTVNVSKVGHRYAECAGCGRAMLLVGLIGCTSVLHAVTINFEDYTPGTSINGQGGWTVQDSWGNAANLFDQAITDDGTGNRVWRISNGYTATSFSNQPFSPAPPAVAGETGAGLRNDYGPDYTHPLTPPASSATATSHSFYGAWDFESATKGAQGTAGTPMTLRVGAAASQSTNQLTQLLISDAGSGFSLSLGQTSNGANLTYTSVASGLSYTDWHRVEMYIDFRDGVVDSHGNTYVNGVSDGVYGNDIVRLLVDGTLVYTGTTWESYYYTTTEGGYAPPTIQAANSLLFRSAGPANAANLGAGLYIDNVVVSNAAYAIPEPASVALIFGAAVGVAGWLRRRRKTGAREI